MWAEGHLAKSPAGNFSEDFQRCPDSRGNPPSAKEAFDKLEREFACEIIDNFAQLTGECMGLIVSAVTDFLSSLRLSKKSHPRIDGNQKVGGHQAASTPPIIDRQVFGSTVVALGFTCHILKKNFDNLRCLATADDGKPQEGSGKSGAPWRVLEGRLRTIGDLCLKLMKDEFSSLSERIFSEEVAPHWVQAGPRELLPLRAWSFKVVSRRTEFPDLASFWTSDNFLRLPGLKRLLFTFQDRRQTRGPDRNPCKGDGGSEGTRLVKESNRGEEDGEGGNEEEAMENIFTSVFRRGTQFLLCSNSVIDLVLPEREFHLGQKLRFFDKDTLTDTDTDTNMASVTALASHQFALFGAVAAADLCLLAPQLFDRASLLADDIFRVLIATTAAGAVDPRFFDLFMRRQTSLRDVSAGSEEVLVAHRAQSRFRMLRESIKAVIFLRKAALSRALSVSVSASNACYTFHSLRDFMLTLVSLQTALRIAQKHFASRPFSPTQSARRAEPGASDPAVGGFVARGGSETLRMLETFVFEAFARNLVALDEHSRDRESQESATRDAPARALEKLRTTLKSVCGRLDLMTIPDAATTNFNAATTVPISPNDVGASSLAASQAEERGKSGLADKGPQRTMQATLLATAIKNFKTSLIRAAVQKVVQIESVEWATPRFDEGEGPRLEGLKGREEGEAESGRCHRRRDSVLEAIIDACFLSEDEARHVRNDFKNKTIVVNKLVELDSGDAFLEFFRKEVGALIPKFNVRTLANLLNAVVNRERRKRERREESEGMRVSAENVITAVDTHDERFRMIVGDYLHTSLQRRE